jgi:hypothetical protein
MSLPIRHKRFHERLDICRSNQCGHYGPDERGRVGCLLHPVGPCRIDSHIMDGKGCLADPPLFCTSVVDIQLKAR